MIQAILLNEGVLGSPGQNPNENVTLGCYWDSNKQKLKFIVEAAIGIWGKIEKAQVGPGCKACLV